MSPKRRLLRMLTLALSVAAYFGVRQYQVTALEAFEQPGIVGDIQFSV